MAKVRRRGCLRATLLASAMIVLSACNPNRFVNGWVPYWAPTEGRQAYTSGAGSMFNDVSPFFYSAQADGSIALVAGASLAQLKTTTDTAHAQGAKVLPTITDGSGKLTMATVILADPTRRGQHEDNIVNLVNAGAGPGSPFDGIDLDYEVFAFTDGQASWPTTQAYWRAFISELAVKLHNNGKLLSVTIPPVWVSGGTQTGYTVYDQQFVGAYADRVKLMVYDWSVSSPGPISPMSWVQQVITYSDPIVPNEKLQLGVPAYGRDWGRQLDSTEACPDGALATKSIEMQNIPALVSAHPDAVLARHGSGEMYFSYDVVATGYRSTPIPPPPYVPPATRAPSIPGSVGTNQGVLRPAMRLDPPTVTCSVRHFVYYPDATTVQMHAQAALDAGWSGVVMWALGYETADVYTMLGNTTP